MGTRAIIQLMESYHELAIDGDGRGMRDEQGQLLRTAKVETHHYATLYQHWDGYPEWRGRVLARMLLAFSHKGKVMDPQAFFMQMLGHMWADGTQSLYLMPITPPVGNVDSGEEYEYVVLIRDDTPYLKCYSTPFGDGDPTLVFEGTPTEWLDKFEIIYDESESWWVQHQQEEAIAHIREQVAPHAHS